ncbi:MAG: hypothetical protein D6813_12335 [Calditrichaeota bacterium]|nr:MAG: hypothetical protein D6813_12335 [Calditrichota bacterium]
MGTKKFVRLLIFIFMVMPVLLLQAQSQKAGGRGYFIIGSHFLQISKLNDMLKAERQKSKVVLQRKPLSHMKF